MTTARRNILLSAFATSPYRGSEPAAGWNIAARLARYCDVTVLVNPGPAGRNRRDIEEHLERHGRIEGLRIVVVDRPPLSRMLQRETQSPLRWLYYVGYAAWQRQALKVARDLHARRPFDLAHHLNISGFREPGYLWKLGIPFLWGPVAGAANLPSRYFSMLGWRDKLTYAARNVVNWSHQALRRRPRQAAQHARHIWAVTPQDRAMLARWGADCELMTDSGTTLIDDVQPRRLDPTRPLRLIWSGLHIGRKGLPILLHALASLDPSTRVELTVLGDGRQTRRCKRLAERLQLNGKVRWIGQVPHAQALRHMRLADALAFTSVLEGTPHVVMEALSLGLPVICHDACGMALAISNDCGIKVPLATPSQSVEGFARAIQKLCSDTHTLEKLSRNALIRAEQLSWDNKAAHIFEVYERILEHSAAQEVSHVR